MSISIRGRLLSNQSVFGPTAQASWARGQFATIADLRSQNPVGQDGWWAWVDGKKWEWNPILEDWAMAASAYPRGIVIFKQATDPKITPGAEHLLDGDEWLNMQEGSPEYGTRYVLTFGEWFED